LGGRLEGDRGGVQVSDQLIEDGLQVRVGRIAGAVSRAPLKEDIKSACGCAWDAGEGIHLRGYDRIEDHTAQISGKQAHDRQCQSCAVGNAVQVHLPIAKRSDESMHIGRIFQRRKGVQVDARLHQAAVTRLQRLVVQAAQRGLRVACSALIQQDQVPI